MVWCVMIAKYKLFGMLWMTIHLRIWGKVGLGLHRNRVSCCKTISVSGLIEGSPMMRG